MQMMLLEAQDKDMELILAWRNNELIYRWFFEQTCPIPWENHYTWWHKRKNRLDWMIVVDDEQSVRKAGSVNVSGLHTLSPSVGIFIGETALWGQGIAKKALLLALDWLKKQEYNQATATILKENARSIRLFESVGFARIGEAREGEWEYLKIL